MGEEHSFGDKSIISWLLFYVLFFRATVCFLTSKDTSAALLIYMSLHFQVLWHMNTRKCVYALHIYSQSFIQICMTHMYTRHLCTSGYTWLYSLHEPFSVDVSNYYVCYIFLQLDVFISMCLTSLSAHVVYARSQSLMLSCTCGIWLYI